MAAFLSANRVLAFLVSLIAATCLSSAETPDVSGTWKWSSSDRNGEARESILKLAQDGDRITGSVTGRGGENPISEAKLDGNQLAFRVKRETQRGSMTADYLATVDGDALKGSIHLQFGDRTMDRDWAARREGVDPTGTWTWQSTRQDGQAMEATLKLKREGDKIIGTIGREGSEWMGKVQNVSVAGNKLRFETVFVRNGRTWTMQNTASVQGKVMKGKVEGTRDGQTWTREWEAKRQ